MYFPSRKKILFAFGASLYNPERWLVFLVAKGVDMDKTALLNRLYANRMLFEQTVSQVSETSMLAQIGPNQHTGKDIIAHLTTWEQRVVRWLRIVARGEIPHSPEQGMTWDDMDRLNALTLAQNKHRPLQEIQADSRRSFQELVEQIQAFSEEELSIPRPFAWVWQGDSPEQGKPLWKSILAGPAYAHYQDHLYDFLVLTDPARHFVPDPTIMQRYAGTYTHERKGTLMFRLSGKDLLLHMLRQKQEILGIALDNVRFAFENFGLVTFQTDVNGVASSLEWWTHLFTRVLPS